MTDDDDSIDCEWCFDSGVHEEYDDSCSSCRNASVCKRHSSPCDDCDAFENIRSTRRHYAEKKREWRTRQERKTRQGIRRAKRRRTTKSEDFDDDDDDDDIGTKS
mgnify:CR=1 FL=1